MNQEKKVPENSDIQGQATCNVNMTFNAVVGVISIAVALFIGYIAYMNLGG